MGTKFNFRSDFAMLIDYIADLQRCNFTDAHAGVDRKGKRQSVSVSMSRSLDNPKNATDIVVRED
jgi:hypothetical protein